MLSNSMFKKLINVFDVSFLSLILKSSLSQRPLQVRLYDFESINDVKMMKKSSR